MEPAKNLTLPLLTGIVAILVVLGAVAYVLYSPPQGSAEPSALDTGPDVSGQVSGAVETPAEKLPATNPFSDYKNPFE